MTAPILLHVPHASLEIPDGWERLFAVSKGDLEKEMLALTDRYTDELFVLEGADRLEFPVSRLLVDPERFERDEDEPMAARGMGAVYAQTHDGRPLKDTAERERLMDAYYRPHHRALARWASDAVAEHDRALIVDCHSFPSRPLPCDLDQGEPRPDACLGTDAYHTPSELVERLKSGLESLGWTVGIDRPYAGTMVPSSAYRRDPRVKSVMVEVSRALYMDEATGHQLGSFGEVCEALTSVLRTACSEWLRDVDVP